MTRKNDSPAVSAPEHAPGRRPCEVCGNDISHDHGRCTNGRCYYCHRDFCTPGGDTSPGHGRGVIATPFSPEAIRARERGAR